MREQVLAGFEGGVDYQSSDPGPWLTRIQAELQAGAGTIAVLGALHGDFAALPDDFVDSPADIDADAVLPPLMELGKLGTGEQKYMPWMQATYVMAANKQALEYLPEGADLNALTYDQLIEWIEGDGRGDRRARSSASPPAPRGSSTASSRATSCPPTPARW